MTRVLFVCCFKKSFFVVAISATLAIDYIVAVMHKGPIVLIICSAVLEECMHW